MNRLLAEPVAVWGGITALVQAIIGLGLSFGWWSWSEDQVGAVMLVLAAVGGLLTIVVRSLVSPTGDA